MKYAYGLVINEVIKDFQRAAFPVKTDKQIFFPVLPLTPIEPAIISGGIESPANIRLGYIVFESGGVKLYDNVHISILPYNRRSAKAMQRRPGDFSSGGILRRSGMPVYSGRT
jgi:hypothetical protein